jgi:hypothetical protein
MAVRGQKAASSFLLAAVAIAFFGWLGSLFIHASPGWLMRLFMVASPVVLWGWALMFLGRRGYLPFPEAAE